MLHCTKYSSVKYFWRIIFIIHLTFIKPAFVTIRFEDRAIIIIRCYCLDLSHPTHQEKNQRAKVQPLYPKMLEARWWSRYIMLLMFCTRSLSHSPMYCHQVRQTDSREFIFPVTSQVKTGEGLPLYCSGLKDKQHTGNYLRAFEGEWYASKHCYKSLLQLQRPCQ